MATHVSHRFAADFRITTADSTRMSQITASPGITPMTGSERSPPATAEASTTASASRATTSTIDSSAETTE